jgi:hypothetical protein
LPAGLCAFSGNGQIFSYFRLPAPWIGFARLPHPGLTEPRQRIVVFGVVADDDVASGDVCRIPQKTKTYLQIVYNVKYNFQKLNRLILFGEHSLRRAIREFVTHYHQARNHQGLGNRLIVSDLAPKTSGTIRRRERLGGLLNFYYRAAA